MHPPWAGLHSMGVVGHFRGDSPVTAASPNVAPARSLQGLPDLGHWLWLWREAGSAPSCFLVSFPVHVCPSYLFCLLLVFQIKP